MEIFANLPLTTQAARIYAAAHIGGTAIEAVEFEDDVDMIRVTVERDGTVYHMDCWLEGGKLYGEW